jgi:ribosomal protein S1
MSRPAHSTNEAAWSEFIAQHGVGDIVDGEVISVVPFGAFVRIGAGVDGLAPQSLWPTVPEVGARIPVRIAAIDVDNKRVSLGPV